MEICFVDESGSAETLCPERPASTPVFVLAGVIVPSNNLRDLNWRFLQLKKEFNSSLKEVRLSDLIQAEVKGSDLRADIRHDRRKRTRRAVGFLDKTLRLLEQHGCRVIGRIIVKAPNVEMVDSAMYSSASSWLCHTFHRYLDESSTEGIVLIDSRTKVKNTPNSVGMATQMFRTGGDPVPRLSEVPVFGHSDSHVALQIADVIASAILFPSASAAYCMDHTWNHHAHSAYLSLRMKFGRRVQKLQYRYFDPSSGQWRGGIYVTGAAGYLPSAQMFEDPAGGTAPLDLSS